MGQRRVFARAIIDKVKQKFQQETFCLNVISTAAGWQRESMIVIVCYGLQVSQHWDMLM